MLLNAKRIPGCVVRKNRVFDGDSRVVRRNTSANPARVIVGNRAIDDRRWRIVNQDAAADIAIAISSSSSNLVARKGAVSNRGSRIFDRNAAALTGGFIASKCGIRDGKSPVGAVVRLHQTAANRRFRREAAEFRCFGKCYLQQLRCLECLCTGKLLRLRPALCCLEIHFW